MRTENRKIVFAGGGTGGHLYPALAVAHELGTRHPQAWIAFIGARRGLEQRLVPEAGYPLLSLSLGGLKGARGLGRLRSVTAAAWSVVRCLVWLGRRRPDVVIGVGGYASGPAVLAARLIGLKTMILEQNHYPGATNRWLAPRVDAVCLPSEAARAFVRGRLHVTGNPVRREFFEVGDSPAWPPVTVLVFGGSRGAHSINTAMIAALGRLSAIRPPIRILHQTGAADESEVERAYAGQTTIGYDVRAFFDDMSGRLSDAHVVVCRAGASTLSELSAAGRPAILIPYPHAADDHQRRNAEVLVRAGGAVIVGDAELTGERLAGEIRALVDDPGRRREMGRAVRQLARPGAAGSIADIAVALIDRGVAETADVS